MVDGLVNVPLDMLAGGTTGAYRFEIAVFDEEDNQLYRDGWERRVSAQTAAYMESGGSGLLEAFRFGLFAGSYEVEVRAYPTDAPDLGVMERQPLSAFQGEPVTSDLYLATRVEQIAEGAGGGSWSITHQGFGIAAAARTSILPSEPQLYYYIELYGLEDAATPVDVAATVRSGDREVYRTPTTEVLVGPGGTPFTGHMSLSGLPPGEYELAMSIAGGEEETSRTASFRMLDAAATAVATVEGAGSYEADYFASLSDAELEETFGGVAVLITDTQRSTFEAFPPEAKRRYLTEFFRSQDPNPDSPGNEFLEQYLERIETARARYEERTGTEERMPWFTDRGRIYIKYGEPQNRVVNYSPSEFGTPSEVIGSGGYAGQPPYEIWQYQNTSFVYLFIEDDRFGHWRLIYSTDPDIASLADWYDRAGPTAMEDLARSFGIKPRFGTGLQ